MTHSQVIGDIRLMLELQADIARNERLQRGVKYSPPQKVSAERLEYEALRDEALVARIRRAAKRRKPHANNP